MDNLPLEQLTSTELGFVAAHYNATDLLRERPFPYQRLREIIRVSPLPVSPIIIRLQNTQRQVPYQNQGPTRPSPVITQTNPPFQVPARTTAPIGTTPGIRAQPRPTVTTQTVTTSPRITPITGVTNNRVPIVLPRTGVPTVQPATTRSTITGRTVIGQNLPRPNLTNQLGLTTATPTPQAPPREANPYRFLSRQQLSQVGRDRDIDLPNRLQEQALVNYDEILPDWIERVAGLTAQQALEAPTAEQMVWLGLRRISVRSIPNARLSDIIRLVDLVPTWTGQTPPPMRVTPSQMLDYPSLHDVFNVAREGYIPRIRSGAQSLALRLGVPNGQINALLTDLARYPPRTSATGFTTILATNPDILRLYLRLQGDLDRTRLELMSQGDLVFAVTRGYPRPMTEDEQRVIQRYQALDQLDPIIRDLLIQLYGFTGRDNALAEVARTPSIPMESFILYVTPEHHQTLINSLAIQVPLGVDSYTYVRDNILYYRALVDRIANQTQVQPFTYNQVPTNLDRYSDLELITNIQAFFPYASRPNLMETIRDRTQNPGWFVPLIRHCGNRETMVGTQTADTTVFLVAFGTLDNYHCYELGELLGAFRFTTEEVEEGTRTEMTLDYETGAEIEVVVPNIVERQGPFIFQNPAGGIFDQGEVQSLQALLRLWARGQGDPFLGEAETAQQLLARIDEGLATLFERTGRDQELVRTFRRLPRDQQQLIEEWLMLVFDAGWYMRRWKGQGCPYPIQEKATTVKIDPEVLTTPALTAIRNLETRMTKDALRFIQQLPTVEYRKGRAIQGNRSLESEWISPVIAGSACIRMASSRFIGSAFYYIRLLTNRVIPGFDPADVVHII